MWNRALKSGKSVCEVVAQPKQFSWYDKKNLLPVPLTDAHVVNYIEAIEQPQAVSSKEHWFYSGARPKWAEKMACKRIGKLSFCKERK